VATLTRPRLRPFSTRSSRPNPIAPRGLRDPENVHFQHILVFTTKNATGKDTNSDRALMRTAPYVTRAVEARDDCVRQGRCADFGASYCRGRNATGSGALEGCERIVSVRIAVKKESEERTTESRLRIPCLMISLLL
jgi:hypothetical protein